MEYLDVVNNSGEPTGEIVERSRAHEEGIPHRTSHVWIFRRKNGVLQVLLQKRSDDKDSHPGCYDISSAGHIPAGSDYVESAVRELKEELGIDAEGAEFLYCGQRHFSSSNVFYGKKFLDNQYSNVYIIWRDMEPKEFYLQKEEFSAVKWFDFDDCYDKISRGSIPNCIAMEELDMLKRKIY